MTENPAWLLGLTMLVSVVHLWLDALALKSDISFWSSTNSLRGVSSSTLITQLVCDAIITAYLWDEGASWLVLGPSLAFAVLQLWKVFKSLGVEVHFLLGIVPTLRYNTDLARTAHEGNTDTHDHVARDHMSVILGPLLVGLAIYGLTHLEYTSWGSYTLRTAVSAVYVFGFIAMTPQLYVNYRLKSVAALNWRALIYRSINTFIDDLFAFIIRAPTMHRISVLRDGAW